MLPHVIFFFWVGTVQRNGSPTPFSWQPVERFWRGVAALHAWRPWPTTRPPILLSGCPRIAVSISGGISISICINNCMSPTWWSFISNESNFHLLALRLRDQSHLAQWMLLAMGCSSSARKAPGPKLQETLGWWKQKWRVPQMDSLNMLAPNPTFAHTRRTHPNNIIYCHQRMNENTGYTQRFWL